MQHTKYLKVKGCCSSSKLQSLRFQSSDLKIPEVTGGHSQCGLILVSGIPEEVVRKYCPFSSAYEQ